MGPIWTKSRRKKFSPDSMPEKVSLQSDLAEASALLFSRAYCIRKPAIFFMTHMLRWRSTMRELSAEARLHFHARSVSSRTERRLHTLAIYGSLALIAAVVLGSLSVHPF